MFQRRFFLASSAAVAFAGCGSSPPLQAAPSRLVGLQLVDRARGEVLPEFRHRGSAWVAGRPGDRYAVRLVNRSGARLMVVLSVDGINAITGQTATPLQSGYVLAPWQQAEITGWRKTDAEAAAFYFTALPDSYAARTERSAHVGVIGVAVFRERRVAPPPPPAPFPPALSGGPPFGRALPEAGRDARADADAATASSRQAGAAEAASPAAKLQQRNESRLGTGHGEREYAPVERTAFERASLQPAEIVQVRYDSHANLVAAGVIRAAPEAAPFAGYVPDPPTLVNAVVPR